MIRSLNPWIHSSGAMREKQAARPRSTLMRNQGEAISSTTSARRDASGS